MSTVIIKMNFLNTFPCIWFPDFTSTFKLWTNKHSPHWCSALEISLLRARIQSVNIRAMALKNLWFYFLPIGVLRRAVSRNVLYLEQ